MFLDHGGFQCGYCTPGMMMNAYSLVLAHPRPSREKVIDAMEGNLCSVYKRILEAFRRFVEARNAVGWWRGCAAPGGETLAAAPRC